MQSHALICTYTDAALFQVLQINECCRSTVIIRTCYLKFTDVCTNNLEKHIVTLWRDLAKARSVQLDSQNGGQICQKTARQNVVFDITEYDVVRSWIIFIY